MKLRIEKKCNDKYTGYEYEAGKEYDFTKERAEEILRDNPDFATLVEKPKAKKEKTETTEKKSVKSSKKKSK